MSHLAEKLLSVAQRIAQVQGRAQVQPEDLTEAAEVVRIAWQEPFLHEPFTDADLANALTEAGATFAK